MWLSLLALCIAITVSVPGECAYNPTLENIRKETCVSATPMELKFTSSNHRLHVNEEEFRLKGLSWFGFETGTYVLHGLWAVSWRNLLSFIVEHNFNAVRIPFSAELFINNPYPNSIDFSLNPELIGLTSIQCIDFIIEQCALNGIIVMLDMHCLATDGTAVEGLWYNNIYPQQTVLDIWKTIALRYEYNWNIFAIDVYNEPFDATWNNTNSATDFNNWCEIVGNTLHDEFNVEWLIFCEGISEGCKDNCFWGENLQNVEQYPVILNMNDKIVYSPHCYGPSVYEQEYFNDDNFPQNMPNIWTTHWGYLMNVNGMNAIVTGEWGGRMIGNDEIWMNSYVDYLISIDATDTFFWCLNPNSGDTGGLLFDDWNTPHVQKLLLNAKLVPNPLQFTFDTNLNQVCYGYIT
eukprot:112467_1